MQFQFRVSGHLPPKKDGATSMWAIELQARRLVRLREAASQALQGHPPLQQNIRLSLTVHVGPVHHKAIGDLDSFVAGVCDGLMSAAPTAGLALLWSTPEYAHIHPKKPLAIADDSAVVAIRAEKLFGAGDEPWYEVLLEGA